MVGSAVGKHCRQHVGDGSTVTGGTSVGAGVGSDAADVGCGVAGVGTAANERTAISSAPPAQTAPAQQ